MRPARAWRPEPDPYPATMTSRLLRWMENARVDAGSDIDLVATSITHGLAQLIDAREAVLLARQWPQDELWPLCRWHRQSLAPFADSSAFVGETFDDAFEMQADGTPAEGSLSARHLMNLVPEEPFWLEQAAPHLQVMIAEICDHISSLVQDDRFTEQPLQSTLAAPSRSIETPGVLSTENEASDIRPSATRIAEVVSEGTYYGAREESDRQSTLPADNLPALIVPLRGMASENHAPLTGLVMLWIDTPDSLVSSHWQEPLLAASGQAGGWLASALRAERFGRSYRELAQVCANAIDGRDAKRAGHSGAVAYYCGLIARSMGLPEPEVERIEFAGLLHDIGKVAVPDAILQKSAPLTLEELDTVRSSTITGADWLRRVDGLETIAAIVRHQAERWDGSGFPDGLSGEEIPVGARVLAVAVRFAAMTKPRADRAAMSVVGGAFEALAVEADAALDPRVVEAFLNAMGRSLGN